ncbi:MAG TPA: hypothetical protein VHX62_01310 [Solirubrobacteraceae bacterium]|nr:hypothetical protein [Solirubrobacteraceae bacterium]
MSNAWASVRIKKFQQVAAGPSIALLRVTGKPSKHKANSMPRPTLLADDGQVVLRFAALPSPPDERGVLRAAYSVPESVITAETVFSLELKNGHAVSLPAPTAGAAKVDPEETAVASEPDREEAGRMREVDKLAELSSALAEAERAAIAHSVARADAEGAAERLRAEADALAGRVAELEATAGRVAELEAAATRVAELEAAATRVTQPEPSGAMAEMAERIEELEALRAHADARLAQVQREAGERVAEVLRQSEERVASAQERLEQAEAQITKSAAAFEELDTWRGELERRMAETTTELAAARTRILEDEETIERLTGELPQARTQAPDPPAAAPPTAAELAELSRRAEAQAAETAARELADAAGRAASGS